MKENSLNLNIQSTWQWELDDLSSPRAQWNYFHLSMSQTGKSCAGQELQADVLPSHSDAYTGLAVSHDGRIPKSVLCGESRCWIPACRDICNHNIKRASKKKSGHLGSESGKSYRLQAVRVSVTAAEEKMHNMAVEQKRGKKKPRWQRPSHNHRLLCAAAASKTGSQKLACSATTDAASTSNWILDPSGDIHCLLRETEPTRTCQQTVFQLHVVASCSSFLFLVASSGLGEARRRRGHMTFQLGGNNLQMQLFRENMHKMIHEALRI